MPDNSHIISLAAGSLMLVVAGLFALGLVWPRWGTKYMGALWPGRLADSHQRQMATRYWVAWLTGQVLLGLNFLLTDFRGTGLGTGWLIVRVGMLTLAIVCFVVSRRFQRQLPPYNQPVTPARRKRIRHAAIAGGIAGLVALFAPLIAIGVFRSGGISSEAARALIVGLSVGGFIVLVLAVLWARRGQ